MNFVKFVARVVVALVFAIPAPVNAEWEYFVFDSGNPAAIVGSDDGNARLSVTCLIQGNDLLELENDMFVSVFFKGKELFREYFYGKGENLSVQARFADGIPSRLPMTVTVTNSDGVLLSTYPTETSEPPMWAFIQNLRLSSTVIVKEPKGEFESGGRIHKFSLSGTVVTRILIECDLFDKLPAF